jgi:hypothetical protein
MDDSVLPRVGLSTRIAVIATTAVFFAGAKGLTGYIPSPWGVGQLFIASFVPLFFVTVSETVPVAIGAGLGSFLGDMIFLLPAGSTNPPLALVAGVLPNILAVLLFGYAVKRYRSWTSFITSTVLALTLGNLMAAGLVGLVGPYIFAPLPFFTSASGLALFVIGLTAFWDSTSIPAVLLIVPVLLRAVKPLRGRSAIMSDYPSWTDSQVRHLVPTSILYSAVFLAIGTVFYLVPWGGSITDITPIKTTIFVGAAVLALVGPLVGRIAGTRQVDHRAAD